MEWKHCRLSKYGKAHYDLMMRSTIRLLMNEYKMRLQLMYGLKVVGVALVGRDPEKSCGIQVLGLAKIDATSAPVLLRS